MLCESAACINESSDQPCTNTYRTTSVKNTCSGVGGGGGGGGKGGGQEGDSCFSESDCDFGFSCNDSGYCDEGFFME